MPEGDALEVTGVTGQSPPYEGGDKGEVELATKRTPRSPPCMDRGHSLHLFGDMVDTMVIIGMTYVCGGGHAVERGVCYVSTERVR